MPKITPFFMFDGNLGEAIDFYASVFSDAVISDISRVESKVQSATLQIGGQTLLAFDGGSHFHFSDATSLFISCEDQAEVDAYWEKLLASGGVAGQCGWLTDQFGVSWQVIPKALGTYLGGEDREGAARAMQTMLGMTKINIAELQRAYEGN